jgi:hypothetical protein
MMLWLRSFKEFFESAVRRLPAMALIKQRVCLTHEYRETRQGPGTSLGAFRVGNPLEQIVPISDNDPQTCCGLASRSSE